MNPEPFATTDLALATYLRLEGINASRLEVDGGEVCWVFAHTGETDRALIAKLRSNWMDGPRADVRQYIALYKNMRQQMNDKMRDVGCDT